MWLLDWILLQVYGLELVELQQSTGKTTKKQYILLNNISTEAQKNFVDSSSEDPKVGLLFIVLGLIFMHGGVVTEGIVSLTLWPTLKLDVMSLHKWGELP